MLWIRQLQDRLRWGSGTPEGVLSAPRGRIFLRDDGGLGSTLYVKEQDSIAGDTTMGWTAK